MTIKTIGMKWNKNYQCWCITLCCCSNKLSPLYLLQTTQTSSSVVRSPTEFSGVIQALFWMLLGRINIFSSFWSFSKSLGIWLFLPFLKPVRLLEEFCKLHLNGSLQSPVFCFVRALWVLWAHLGSPVKPICPPQGLLICCLIVCHGGLAMEVRNGQMLECGYDLIVTPYVRSLASSVSVETWWHCHEVRPNERREALGCVS